MRYISQPVEVDAWQHLDNPKEILDHLETAPNVISVSTSLVTGGIHFKTSDGAQLLCAIGDWLIKRPNGAVSVLPDRVFVRKYTRLL